MDFNIRQAVESDAEAISVLVTYWAHLQLEDPAPPEADEFLNSLTPSATARRISANDFEYYVAENSAGICGTIAIREKHHLYHLFVRADSHGKGIARALWEHAKYHSDSQTFVVNSSITAIPVYEQFGFVVKGSPQSARGLTFVPMEYSRSANNSFKPKLHRGSA